MFWIRFRDRFVNLRIILLDGQKLDYHCKISLSGREVVDYVLDHLNLFEREYFGLRYLDSNDQVHWLDTNKSLKKQLKKCTTVTLPSGATPYIFYFCVKFYAAEPADLLEEVTRYQFFIQIRQDIQHSRLPVPEEALAELGACSLQSEIGDFDPDHHEPGYSAHFQFTPGETSGRFSKLMENAHKNLRGLSPAEAEMRFLNLAKNLDLYGVDLHPVLGEPDISDPYTPDSGYFLGLSPVGFVMVHNNDKLCEFPWRKVLTIRQDIWASSPRDKGGSLILTVRGQEDKVNTLGFRLATRDACKHLWKTALEHQKFYKKSSRGSQYFNTFFSRFGSKFRASSRTDSESPSTTSDRRVRRAEPKVDRPASVRKTQKPRVPASVIYEDHRMTVTLQEDGEVRQQLKMPLPENYDRLPNLPRPIASRSLRNFPQRSSSPMSVQSSYSTNPRRVFDPAMENDDDSVFSSGSRMSRSVVDGRGKRKRSTVGENVSSGNSDETEPSRTPDFRSSLGPQRRRGKAPMRHRTVDSSVTSQVLAEMRNSPVKDPQRVNLPDVLSLVMQPARSMNYLNGPRVLSPLNSPVRNGGFNFNLDVRKQLVIPPPIMESRQDNYRSLPRSRFRDVTAAVSPIPTSTVPAFQRVGSEKSPRIPSSPLKPTKSFDFRVDPQPQLSLPPVNNPEPESPKHLRSLSSSGTPRKNPPRSRLRSDSHFLTRDESLVNESSPLINPFPIIPPPTPFTEARIDTSPPEVPARPPHTFKSHLRNVQLNKPRPDSFINAVNHEDLEMKLISPTRDTHRPLVEPTYETVNESQRISDCAASRHVVEVDIHMPSYGDASGTLKKNTGGDKSMTNGIDAVNSVHNQMYLHMDAPQSDRSTGKSIQVDQKTNFIASPATSILFHPLAYSTSTESIQERYILPNGTTSHSSSDNTSITGKDRVEGSLGLLQSVYSSENRAMFTSI